jgi:hypothetical protein
MGKSNFSFQPLPPEDGDEPLDLGACCACGKVGPDVRNIVMLDRRARVKGTGWGCVVCGLPTDGALVVVCDFCLMSNAPYKWVIDGYPDEKKRIPIEDLPDEPFEHDQEAHEYYDSMMADAYDDGDDEDYFWEGEYGYE